MTIELRDVAKSFGAFRALDGISLRVARGELVALLGPSGCGKTTILRLVAGLDLPDRGEIFFDGDEATHRPAGARGVGFVFQSYALFEHMTVHENVAFALRVRGERDAVVKTRVAELLERVRLADFGPRRPSQLSGGQRQRVAIARALAASPGVLLLDEPFGALDAHVRQEHRTWLRALHDETRTATVLVTHDREDAFAIADRVVVLHEGRVAQSATPRELAERPASPWVARFLGSPQAEPRG